ncbi:MAG: hypothetical protein V8T10_00450 [Merdibacter sp.]
MIQRFLLEGVVRGAGPRNRLFRPADGLPVFLARLPGGKRILARIAFLADKVMSYFHLSGKALIAMVLGFG